MKDNMKKGMSLIEALVAISIFSIGILGFSQLFIQGWKTNKYVFEMGQSSSAVSYGMEQMVGLLRRARQGDDGAYPVRSAQDNDVVFFSDSDKDGITERVHLYKSGNRVMMGTTKPTATLPKSYPAGDQQTITLASAIVNDASTPIFYYFNKDYPADMVNNPVETPASPADIRLMKILLKINIDPNRDPENIQMQSFVELRNLNDYDRVK